MTKMLVSAFVKEEQLQQLSQLARAHRSCVAAQMGRAHKQFLADQFATHGTELEAWAAKVLGQRRTLLRWRVQRFFDPALTVSYPEAFDVKPIAYRSIVGCMLTSVGMTDEQEARFYILGAFHGLSLGAQLETAYGQLIQAEMLDDPDAFAEQLRRAEVEIVRDVERFLALPHPTI